MGIGDAGAAPLQVDVRPRRQQHRVQHRVGGDQLQRPIHGPLGPIQVRAGQQPPVFMQHPRALVVGELQAQHAGHQLRRPGQGSDAPHQVGRRNPATQGQGGLSGAHGMGDRRQLVVQFNDLQFGFGEEGGVAVANALVRELLRGVLTDGAQEPEAHLAVVLDRADQPLQRQPLEHIHGPAVVGERQHGLGGVQGPAALKHRALCEGDTLLLRQVLPRDGCPLRPRVVVCRAHGRPGAAARGGPPHLPR